MKYCKTLNTLGQVNKNHNTYYLYLFIYFHKFVSIFIQKKLLNKNIKKRNNNKKNTYNNDLEYLLFLELESDKKQFNLCAFQRCNFVCNKSA